MTVDLHPVLRFGPFRSSDGLLYRRFQHSWPLYRRHIYLTIRAMSLKKYQTKIEPEIELSDAVLPLTCLAAERLQIHSRTSRSYQPTARAPRLACAGNLPFAMVIKHGPAKAGQFQDFCYADNFGWVRVSRHAVKIEHL
jgi:hypothetical protein